MEPLFVLVHSPLVGPLTWSLVARELERAGIETLAPVLEERADAEVPFWRQHAEAVARQLQGVPEERELILVGHSGAGPLLPAIKQAAQRPAAAYLFADAGIPEDGKSRLDLLWKEDPAFAGEFQSYLASGGCFPTWSEEELREVIPEPGLRAGMVEELRPRSLAFFEEPIPVFEGWPDAPCGYLQFSAAYDTPAEQARRQGWAFRKLDAGHFHMLVDPVAVAASLRDISHDLRPGGSSPRPL